MFCLQSNKLRKNYMKWYIKTQILRYVSACWVGRKRYYPICTSCSVDVLDAFLFFIGRGVRDLQPKDIAFLSLEQIRVGLILDQFLNVIFIFLFSPFSSAAASSSSSSSLGHSRPSASLSSTNIVDFLSTIIVLFLDYNCRGQI